MLVRHAAIYANDFDWEEYMYATSNRGTQSDTLLMQHSTFSEPFVQKLRNTTVDWRSAGPL
jgi:acid phosphatase